MPLPDMDTTVGWSFGLEFDGVVIKQIQEISGLKMDQDVIDLKENTADGKYVIKRLPGRPQAGEVTLTRGLTADTSFNDWMKKSRLADMGGARKGGAIIVYDHMNQPLRRYNLKNCWAKSLEIGSLKAGDTSVLTEKLTLTHEGCEPE